MEAEDERAAITTTEAKEDASGEAEDSPLPMEEEAGDAQEEFPQSEPGEAGEVLAGEVTRFPGPDEQPEGFLLAEGEEPIRMFPPESEFPPLRALAPNAVFPPPTVPTAQSVFPPPGPCDPEAVFPPLTAPDAGSASPPQDESPPNCFSFENGFPPLLASLNTV